MQIGKKALIGVAASSALAVGVMPLVSSAAVKAPPVSVNSFTSNFSFMNQLKSVTAAGHGKVGVLLPDTVTSARYVQFDAPLLTKAFKLAGLAAGNLVVSNAQGVDATELSQAQADVTGGASVLIMDPLDSGIGAQIESYAAAHKVKVIDYDRLTLDGTASYYVSFNNVAVGTAIGNGLVSCLASWKVKSPKIIEGYGSTTDNNATLFGQGYDAVLKAHKLVPVTKLAGTWDPTVAQTEFEGAFTAHPTANALLSPNDANAAGVITYLQGKGVKPYTFPTTGQDASTVGLQNIISGYQCGTVYKPVFLEAQAAATLALFLRAGLTPGSALVNGKTNNHKANVASVLLNAEWVTPSTIEKTVVADGAVTAATICTSSFKADCTKYGIK